MSHLTQFIANVDTPGSESQVPVDKLFNCESAWISNIDFYNISLTGVFISAKIGPDW